MLPENESPTRPEDQPEIEEQLEETPAVEEVQDTVPEVPDAEEVTAVQEEGPVEVEASETEVIQEETVAETKVAEVPVAEESEPVVESVEETPAVIEESPAAEEVSVEGETSDSSETESAEETEEEAPVIPQPEVSDALLARIDEILSDKESTDLITASSAVELIHALDYFTLAEDTRSQVPRVGLVKRSFDALGGSGELPDEVINAFRISLGNFNKKRTELQKQADTAKEGNSNRKKELLEKLRGIVEAEDAMRIQEVRAVQDEWKTIGHVLKEDIEPLYKNYRYLLDKFYKLREMHFEMLDYDRKINLQEKERLIAEATALVPAEEDRDKPEMWKEKMDLLTELQQQWKSVGHVPREDMERINSGYRAAIDGFFDIRQGFMKEMDAEKDENGKKKEAILEKMEAFRAFDADKPRLWNEATQELRVHQDEWKTIGQASYTKNNELWNRYREICNAFFSRKSEFFRKFDEVRNVNLELKRGLVEKAEALKESQDMESAAKELKNLQREWKEIGPVPGRYSNKLWNRFRAACDAFFEQRREHYQGMHADENANLELKKQVIEKAKKLEAAAYEDPGKAVEAVKALQADWKEIGKVPYKQKDVVWDEFRAAIDSFFDNLSVKQGELRELKLRASMNMGGGRRNSGGGGGGGGGGDAGGSGENRQLKGKIFKMRKRIQQSEAKIEQYSTNIQFISKGKSGDTLRVQIQKEIDKEIRLVGDLKAQLKVMNDVLRNPPKPEAPAVVETPAEEAPAAEAPAKEEAPAAEETETPVAEEAAPADEPVAEETESPVVAEAAPAAEPVVEKTEAPVVEEAAPVAEPVAETPAAEEVEAAVEETPEEPEKPAEE